MTLPLDQDAINAKINATGKQPLPNGLSEADYVDHEKWTNKQWSWEFLRRKKPYQLYCKRYKKNNKISSDSSLNPTFRKLFGLERHIYYTDKYCDDKLEFITEHVGVYSATGNRETVKPTTLKLRQVPGDLYLKFDLEIAAKSKKNVDQLIKKARLVLEYESSIFAKNNGVIAKETRNRIRYIDLIRLIDLDRTNKLLNTNERLTTAAMFMTIFPINAGIHRGGVKKSDVELQKLFSKKWSIAKEYMKKDRYLALAATED